MVDTPTVLLDVDGVLNVTDDPLFYDDVVGLTAVGFRIQYSLSIVERIAQWHKSGRFNVEWLTTWEHHANEELADHFSFPQLHTHYMSDNGLGISQWYYFGEQWWKWLTVKRLMSGSDTQRFIWIDDDINNEQHARAWIAEQDPSRLLAISPYPALTHAQLDQIEEWADEHVSG